MGNKILGNPNSAEKSLSIEKSSQMWQNIA
jgi:hypothetical protein